MENLLSSGSSKEHNACTLSDDDKRAAIDYFDQVEKASKSKAVEVRAHPRSHLNQAYSVRKPLRHAFEVGSSNFL